LIEKGWYLEELEETVSVQLVEFVSFGTLLKVKLLNLVNPFPESLCFLLAYICRWRKYRKKKASKQARNLQAASTKREYKKTPPKDEDETKNSPMVSQKPFKNQTACSLWGFLMRAESLSKSSFPGRDIVYTCALVWFLYLSTRCCWEEEGKSKKKQNGRRRRKKSRLMFPSF